MNHHILTVHKSDYNGSIEQLELALSIRIESVAPAAFLARAEDETTHELTLLNGTFAQASDLRHFAEGVMLAQELSRASQLCEALKQLRDAFIHTPGNTKGNKAKTDIIKYNEDVKDALNNARHVINENAKGA